MRVRKKLRFLASSALSNTTITGQTIAGACGGICTTVNGFLTPWCSTIRLRRVTIWPTVGSAAGVADITWATDGTLFVKDEFKVTTLPQAVTIHKSVTSVPPSGTLVKFWQAATDTNTIFTITAPGGSVIDVLIEFTLANELTGTTLGIVSGVLGTVYYLALDGPGGNKARPVGLVTTA